MKPKEMIKTIALLVILSILFTNSHVLAQDGPIITGKVVSSLNTPVKGASVSIEGVDKEVTTDDVGVFTIQSTQDAKLISIWATGYYPVSQLINNRSEIIVVLTPLDKYKYNESAVLPFQIKDEKPYYTSAKNLAKKDFLLGSMKIDRALSGQVAGLQVTRNGGMPGEGSYINMRGIRTLTANNAPLIVINGVPYLPDNRESLLINGFTRDIFQAYNIEDIQNITVLKGASASLYGSLGSNGVILIETDGATSEDLDTKISFSGQYGMNWNNKRMPLLKGQDYKSYLSDVGMTYFNNMESFFAEFPFINNPDSRYYYLYNNQTDWQDEIYRNSFVTDNIFRVEGGDAIAKYDLSLGYSNENGILDNTSFQRYHTQLNTNVLASKEFEIFATFGLAFINGSFQEQGMIAQTNPILAAYSKAPLLSPYNKDNNGNTLSTFAPYYYGISKNMDFATSNPLAIIQTLDARARQHDITVKTGVTYHPSQNLSITGTFGLYYNYNNEHLFVPGITDVAILPFFDKYGEANNSVKEGVGETLNLYYNLNGRYNKTWNNLHSLNVLAGMQIVTSKNEYDAGSGRNTPNDFYQTLNNSEAIGRHFYGYIDKWNWMNFYAHADYSYKKMVTASLNMAVDGASSAGTYGQHFFLYPSLGVTWLGKGWLPLSNSTLINDLNVRAEYGLTGNSRFSSRLGKFYYRGRPYQDISGIVRAGIPNTKLKPERNKLLNVGSDLSLLYNRVGISFDYYLNRAEDVIFAVPSSPAYGSAPYYDNLGVIENRGIELAIQITPIQTKQFEWIIGGNIALNKNKVKSLGGVQQLVTKYSDGSQLITKVGESPYQFYGYQASGIYSTQAEADKSNLFNSRGNAFQAGDVRFSDVNGDHRIDDNDRVPLGSAAPKYFGGFFTNFKYNAFSLSAEFVYSKGNKAYNAVRRDLESLSTLGNQSSTVVNRWTLEGQVTDIPRAQYSDPMGNNDFSSRWIEDASFIKMRNITFSYHFDNTFLQFFRSGTIYVTGENLLTFTKYLGLDPEFSYSPSDNIQGFDYAKLMQPKGIKFGVNLKF